MNSYEPPAANVMIEKIKLAMASSIVPIQEEELLTALWRKLEPFTEAAVEAYDTYALISSYEQWERGEGSPCRQAYERWCATLTLLPGSTSVTPQKPQQVGGSVSAKPPERRDVSGGSTSKAGPKKSPGVKFVPDVASILGDASCPGCGTGLASIRELAEHAVACERPLCRRKPLGEQPGQAQIYPLSGSLNEAIFKQRLLVREKVPDFKGYPICDYHLPVRLPCCSELFPLNQKPNTYTRSSSGVAFEHYTEVVKRNTSVGIRRELDGKFKPENAGTYLNYLSGLAKTHRAEELVETWDARDVPDIYDGLINYHRYACQYVVGKVKLGTKGKLPRDFVFSHDYTCVLIKVPQQGGFPCGGQRSIETLLASILVAYLDHETAARGLDMPCAMRASFGYLSPTAGGLDGSVVRVSLGVGPKVYLDAVASAIGRFLDDVWSAMPYVDTLLVEQAPEMTLRQWYAKKANLADALCLSFGGQAELTKLAVSALCNGANGVLCAMAGVVLGGHLRGEWKLLPDGTISKDRERTFPAFYSYVPLVDLGIVGPLPEDDDRFLPLAKLIVGRALSWGALAHDRELEVALEGKCYLNDAWWGMLLASRLMTWKSLEAFYLPRRAQRADRRQTEEWGSDSEDEDEGLYHLKLVTHGGMHAIRVALEFVVDTFAKVDTIRNVGMYYELPELHKVINGLRPSSLALVQHKVNEVNYGANELLLGDRNHCLKELPLNRAKPAFDGIHNMKAGWQACQVVVDVTSSSVAEMGKLVNQHRRRLAEHDGPPCCLILVSSGLKNEQTGEDINPYGTVRFFVRQRDRDWLQAALKCVQLSTGARLQEGLVSSGLHHSVRRWHLFMGTATTVKGIWPQSRNELS